MARKHRQPQWPLVNAFNEVAGSTLLGGKPVPGDIDQAPDCPAPYYIVTVVNEIVDGSMESPEADSMTRIQVVAIGVTGEQSTKLMDKLRAQITMPALNTHMTDHRIIELKLDVMRGTNREERGLPEPFISKIDQYLVSTTPATA